MKDLSSYFRFPLFFLILLSLCYSSVISANTTIESSRLALIKQRGELVVGVKSDYPPWAYYDEKGQLTGLEIDLAQDIADRLNVALRLQVVTSSNRITQLEQGAIDIVIATMGDTKKRRRQTGILEPSYYSSGATIVVPEESTLHSWSELYGRSVCLTKNAYFNRDLTERFLLKAQEYEGTRDNMAALKFGKCTGWIYDDTALTRLLQDTRWQNFKTPLPAILINPWAIAVKKSEQYSELGIMVSDAIIDWHRTGKILALEEKWDIGHSQFIIEQNKKWTKKTDSGQYHCQRKADNRLPTQCLSRKSIAAADALKDNFLSNWGIDFPPIYDSYSLHTLLKGIGLTLLLSVGAIIGSLLFGVAAGIGLHKLPSPIAWLMSRVNDIFRMTPPLLNLYIIFFGLGGLFALHYGIRFDAIIVALIVFSLYAGASNASLISQALNAEKHLFPNTTIRQRLPAAFQHAYEGINANAVNIVKAVGIASVIAVPEIISASNKIIAEYGSKLEMMTFLLVFYFMIVYLFIFLLQRLKRAVLFNHKTNHETSNALTKQAVSHE
ncbi:ABC transporter permease subunit [Eionea flava]